MSSLDDRIRARIVRGADTPVDEEFEQLAKDLFQIQFESIAPYREHCLRYGVSPKTIRTFHDIPPLPTTAFRRHRLATFSKERTVATFHTTGTTAGSIDRGVHEFDTTELYELSCLTSFRDLTPKRPSSLLFISFIPSRYEAPRSSLAHMVDHLARTLSPSGAVCPFREEALDMALVKEALLSAERSGTPVFVASTSAALSDFLDDAERTHFRVASAPGSQLFETGGRKGRRYLPTSFNLADRAEIVLGISREGCLAEYGMTELSSPSWGHIDRERVTYRSPAWAPITIVDPRTLEEVANGCEGLVRVFDLANRGSVSALLTGDWGRRREGRFEVLGRVMEADLRGCSLAVSAPLASFDRPSMVPSFSKAAESVMASHPVSVERRIESLATLVSLWADSASEERKDFEKKYLSTRSMPPGALKAGLDQTFRALSESEFERRCGLTERLIVTISAGNLPVTGVFDFFRAILSGSPSMHRPSSRGGDLLGRLHASLKAIDPDLAARTAVVTTPSYDLRATRELLLNASSVIVQGDDSTLEETFALTPAAAKFLPRGPKVSAAYIEHPATISTDELTLLARDILLWEQQGCLSPQIAFVRATSPNEMISFVQNLAHATEDLARSWGAEPSLRDGGRHAWLARDADPSLHTFYLSEFLAVVSTLRPVKEWFSTPGLIQCVNVERSSDVESLLSGLQVPVGAIAGMPGYPAIGSLQSPAFDA